MNILARACLKSDLEEVIISVTSALYISDEEGLHNYVLDSKTWREATPLQRAALLTQWLHAEALDNPRERRPTQNFFDRGGFTQIQ